MINLIQQCIESDNINNNCKLYLIQCLTTISNVVVDNTKLYLIVYIISKFLRSS